MSLPVIRVRCPLDTVNGGMILGGSQLIYVNGYAVALAGSPVAAHAPFTGAHNNATMFAGSTVYGDAGRRVVIAGDLASCGHAVSGGSPNVFAG